jgi:hypothetical protein
MMELLISDDGNLISGMARSASGAWSGRVAFRRIERVPPGRTVD